MNHDKVLYVLTVALAAFGATSDDGHLIAFAGVIALLQIADSLREASSR